jgi:PAS domain S-box-containing protein
MTSRIILADDHPIVRQGLSNLLARESGLEVVGEAVSGPQLLEQVAELDPEVVILDLGLPGLQGGATIQQILDKSPQIKIIALSIYTERRFVVNILKAGASGYLLKDCAFEELAGAIRTIKENRIFISPGLKDIVVQDYIEALRASEARFRTIFDEATLGIALVDQNGCIVETNPALQRILGYRQEELLNRKFTGFILPEEAARCADFFRKLMESPGESYHGEKKFIRPDGRSAWVRLTATPFAEAREDGKFAICLLEDITVQKQAEKDIRAYQEQLRSVASELSLTEERERRRLATEFHDHVGQILALAQIKLGALRQSASSTELGEPMDEVRRLIEQTIQYTRSLTFELSPPILYDLGFDAAVEWLAELFHEQHGISIKVQTDRSAKIMSDELRVLLFQTIRELLGNAVKFAGARNIKLFIAREDGSLRVKMEDDGLGTGASTDLSQDGPSSFGIFSIRERLKYLGGRLDVATETGWGTRVTLQVPLKN